MSGRQPQDVLERNVRLLVRRSYVPALPAPHFRDRLETLFLGEALRRAQRPASGAFSARRALALGAALAAALVALLLGWRSLGAEGPPTRERLLASGAIALGLPDDTWRAVDEQERLRGLVLRSVPPASFPLLVATPTGGEIDVHAAGGRVHVRKLSEVRFERGAEGELAILRAGTAWFESGSARVDLAPLVPCALRAPSGAAAAAPTITARAQSERELLAPGPAPAPATPVAARVLTGRVSSAGVPLTAFTVGLLRERTGNETHPPSVRTFASQDGVFRWEDPPAGKQRVFVHADGHALCALGEHDLARELPQLVAELEPGASVRGSVLDEAGNPVADALVLSENDVPTDGLFLAGSEHDFWLPIQARTGPDGRFELAHLTPGRHVIRASAAGHAPSWIDAQAPLERQPSAAGELVITLGLGGTIEGLVTREDGGPWAECEVVVVAMDQGQRRRESLDFTHTDSAGRYRFEHLPPLTMIVVIMREENRPEVRPVQVVDGLTITVDFVAPRRGTRLHGHVLAADGAPMAFENLGLFDLETASWNQDWIASTTRADGGYAFEGVLPGNYQFFLIDEMGRGLRCVDELQLAPGLAELVHDVRVPSGTLELTVFAAASAEPLPETALVLMRTEPDGRTSFAGFGQSDAEGRFRFVEQRPGTYTVFAYPSGPELGYGQSEPVTLDEGGSPSLEIGLEAGGTVGVVVRDPTGRALEGAFVVFIDEAGAEHTFSRLPLTDSQGRYRAHGLRPGRYRVTASFPGHQGTPVPFRFELGRELEVPVLLAPVAPIAPLAPR